MSATIGMNYICATCSGPYGEIATLNVVSETTMARCAMVVLRHERALLPLLGQALAGI